MLDEASVEHASAKGLIAQIRGAHPLGRLPPRQVLDIGHDVIEEHAEIFPKRRRSKTDLVGLRRSLETRKKELQDAAPPGSV